MLVWKSLGLLLLLAVHCLSQDPFTLDDYLSGRFGARGYGGQWISGNEVQLRDGNGNVVITNLETNRTTTILASGVLSVIGANSFDFSSDRQYVLISYDTQSQFRHSTTARYVVYSLATQKYTDVAEAAFLQTAHWGPTGRSLLYILNNDIYYTSDFASSPVLRVTDSGIPGVIYNGVPDWVYEEEVLAASTAYWFSPDGSYLLFLEFNDTHVPEMTYMKYGKPGTLEDQYPMEVTIRYPKAGARNPSHTSFLVKLTDPVLRPLPIRSDVNGDTVTYGLSWVSNVSFTEQVMNRVQSQSTISICDLNLDCREFLSESNNMGWVRERQRIFDSSARAYISVESRKVNDQETYNHLVARNASTTRFLTDGSYNVLNIIGWDEATGNIYYSGTEEEYPSRTQVYRVSFDGGPASCISCSITTPESNKCTSASARFSTDYKYVIITCSAPDPTVVTLFRNLWARKDPCYWLKATKHIHGRHSLPCRPMDVWKSSRLMWHGRTQPLELVYDLETNSALRSLIKTKNLPVPVDYIVPIGGGFNARARLLLPPNMDANKKYPLLINVYGGPDYNQVTDGWSVGWQTYLGSSLGIIYGYIDGRGSGRKSDEILFSNYRVLGTYEIIDQINVTSWLQQHVPNIDSSRTAIWGWSYGGYATGRTLELDTEGVFKCGISVAPVTNWIYYDSIYTERYMGLPTQDDNLAAYKSGDLVSNVNNLKNKQYYLIHGNGDDNVHYQQSMLFSRALELNDIIFQQQSYPDENHSLGGVSRHLYHSMDKFWKSCFALN